MFIRKFNAPEGFGLRLGIEIRRKNDGFWARNPKLGKIWEIGKYREYRYYRYWYRENTEIPVSRKKPISPIPMSGPLGPVSTLLWLEGFLLIKRTLATNNIV